MANPSPHTMKGEGGGRMRQGFFQYRRRVRRSPLKLMLFVLVDGWTLVVKTLLDGFVVNI